MTVLIDENLLESYKLREIRKALGSKMSHLIISPINIENSRWHEDLYANEPMGDNDVFWSEVEQWILFRHNKNLFAKPPPPLSTRLRKAISKRIPHKKNVYHVDDVSKNKSVKEPKSLSNRARKAFSDIRHRIPHWNKCIVLMTFKGSAKIEYIQTFNNFIFNSNGSQLKFYY